MSLIEDFFRANLLQVEESEQPERIIYHVPENPYEALFEAAFGDCSLTLELINESGVTGQEFFELEKDVDTFILKGSLKVEHPYYIPNMSKNLIISNSRIHVTIKDISDKAKAKTEMESNILNDRLREGYQIQKIHLNYRDLESGSILMAKFFQDGVVEGRTQKRSYSISYNSGLPLTRYQSKLECKTEKPKSLELWIYSGEPDFNESIKTYFNSYFERIE